MLGVGWTEMLVIGVVALIVIGPRDLPAMMRRVGQFAGTIRRMGQDFQRELNKTTGLNEITNLRNSVTQPLKATADAIRKEFNTTTPSGQVQPSGALKPADPKAESVVDEIKAAAGMTAPAAAATVMPAVPAVVATPPAAPVASPPPAAAKAPVKAARPARIKAPTESKVATADIPPAKKPVKAKKPVEASEPAEAEPAAKKPAVKKAAAKKTVPVPASAEAAPAAKAPESKPAAKKPAARKPAAKKTT